MGYNDRSYSLIKYNIMTSTTKSGVALVAVLAIVIIGWSIYSGDAGEKLDAVAIEPQVIVTPEPVLPNTFGTGLSREDDTSNEALQNDIDAFGKQMTALVGDAAIIDSILAPTK